MVLGLLASLAILFSDGAAPLKIQGQPSATAATTQNSAYDSEAERQLLLLANQARAQAGLPPLQPDEGLRNAARAHTVRMAQQRQLSHQFSGEPALPQRLAEGSDQHLDRSGENVAYAGSAEQAEETLMHSPPHRENLLSPEYNAAGFGVVREGNTLYITQDFAHRLPMISAESAEQMVANQLNHVRSQDGLPPLRKLEAASSSSACPAGQPVVLRTSAAQPRYILRYTSMDPAVLPPGTEKATRDRDLRTFTVGACYTRNATYPSGAYWVVVQFF